MELEFKDLVSVISESIDNDELLREVTITEAEEDVKEYKIYVVTKRDTDSGEEIKTTFYAVKGIDGEYGSEVTIADEAFTGTPSELQQKLDSIRGN